MAASVKVTGGTKWKKALQPYCEHPNGGVLVGVTENDTYAEGPAKAQGLTVAQNLAFHEFGTSRTPMRRPIRATAEAHLSEWCDEAVKVLKATRSAKEAINAAGRKAAIAIQKAIDSGALTPGLKASTVKRKTKLGYGVHAHKPLVLTGTMERAIQSKWYDDLGSI